MITQPYLELLTERLRLSPIRPTDLPDLQAIWADPLVARYLPGGEPYRPEVVQAEVENILAHWKAHGLGIFAVRLRSEQKLLGYCGIQLLHEGAGGVSAEALARWGNEFEILYGLDQEAWGQGLASEAAYVCLRYAFEVAGLERVVAGIHPDNTASRFILTHRLGLRLSPQLAFYGEYPHFTISRQDHSPAEEPLFNLSTDPARLDIEAIEAFLAQAYWSQGRRSETIQRSIRGSLNFGVYDRCRQVGFARIISDCATFAWLCDVFIDEAYRGLGLGTWSVGATLAHPELQGLRRWMLATRDAHGLYKKWGYEPLPSPERWMNRFDPDAT
jgi:RimJ/RimL family protein N-acetyltransferase/N-acetylglutamate synthase-like GNAT family acetyltransferase